MSSTVTEGANCSALMLNTFWKITETISELCSSLLIAAGSRLASLPTRIACKLHRHVTAGAGVRLQQVNFLGLCCCLFLA